MVDNTHWTNNLFSLRIEADIDPYLAGQYTSLALDIDGVRVAQPYSILSAPDEKPLEFFFYTQVEGDLSRALSTLTTGASVWLQRQPEGSLTLAQVADTDVLCLMATGTGVAPFISILKTAEPWARFKQVVLVYAARVCADLRYQELFRQLTDRYPGRFHLLPFVSRENPADTPEGVIHGHIPASLDSGELEQVLGFELRPTNSHVMLCGNPGMVRDAVAILQARGFTENRPDQPGQISHESYW